MAHAPRLNDLFSPLEFDLAVKEGYVRVQHHPTLPLHIANYAEKAQYENVWNPVTTQCRGLIYDDQGYLVARPYRKFFNYGDEKNLVGLDLDAPAYVSDKLDGSLGIAYPTPDGPAIATRGSFTSEQARHATELLRSKYPNWRCAPGLTHLFEIIYPENRIVVDYGSRDDLVLHGIVDDATGFPHPPHDQMLWTGPRATPAPYRTLREALEAEPRPNAEGLVVTYEITGQMLKLKQADYVALHRIVTNSSARVIWQYLAINACAAEGISVKDMVRMLHVGPERIHEVLSVGSDWLDTFLAGVPDEFYDWVRKTHDGLVEAALARLTWGQDWLLMSKQYWDTRRGLPDVVNAAEIQQPDSGLIYALADGKSVTAQCWLYVFPGDERPFARSESVA